MQGLVRFAIHRQPFDCFHLLGKPEAILLHIGFWTWAGQYKVQWYAIALYMVLLLEHSVVMSTPNMRLNGFGKYFVFKAIMRYFQSQYLFVCV